MRWDSEAYIFLLSIIIMISNLSNYDEYDVLIGKIVGKICMISFVEESWTEFGRTLVIFGVYSDPLGLKVV